LVSPLICLKCGFDMKKVSFIKAPTVDRKILQHLGLSETQPRPPPKKIISSCTVEPILEDYILWVWDPIYEYNHIDPI